MSIIHDALKKVQTNLQEQEQSGPKRFELEPLGGGPLTPPQPKVEPAPRKITASGTAPAPRPKSPKGRLIFLFAALCAAAYITYTQYSPQIAPLKRSIQSMARSVPAVTLPAPSPTPVADPNVLKLEGVMNNNGAMLALINGKIYEEGSAINGAKIVRIGENTVTISRDGEEEVLQVRSQFK